jgi:hypothetical protein
MNGEAGFDSSDDDYETGVMYERRTRKVRHNLTRLEPSYDINGDDTSLQPLIKAENYFEKEGK